MTQFKVINRVTKEVQIFNTEEILNFFRCEYDPQTKKIKYYNNIRDYAISEVKSKLEQNENLLWIIALAGCSVSLVVLITDLILKWI
jgi:hypothetical protein|tara:strand:- start:7579 stop:7839 length:261 start_codon:yes stop_codon:yes gene_type:complete